MFKLIIILAAAGAANENGWTPVERPQQSVVQPFIDESDTSWPVFVRQFGSDRVLIRFPDEPTYIYPHLDREDLETMYIEAKMSEDFHRLSVEPLSVSFEIFIEQKKMDIASQEDSLLVAADAVDVRMVDFLYRNGKKWVRERVIASTEHFYTLQTVRETFDDASHLQFVNSFDLETRDKNKVFHREIQGKN